MALYRITIDKANTNDDGTIRSWERRVEINTSTPFKLDQDIPEWIREEIDPNAEFTESAYMENDHDADDTGN